VYLASIKSIFSTLQVLSNQETKMAPALIAVIVGWISGMIVNYLSDVLPYRRSFAAPFCIQCGAPMKLLNYLFWPRRCEICGKHRSIRSWLVEIVFVGFSLWLWYGPPQTFGFFGGLILMLYFGVVTVIDAEHRLILHPVSLVGAALGAVVGVYLHGVYSTLLGGAAGFGLMLILYYLGVVYVQLIAHRKRKLAERRADSAQEEQGEVGEGIGFGDVNLSGVIGLMLGWPGIVAGLVLGIILAGIASLGYILYMILSKRYHPNMALPYGPYLVAAAVFLL
jgi:leader peptidase (prepilin peptidase)/N-methyltransferase